MSQSGGGGGAVGWFVATFTSCDFHDVSMLYFLHVQPKPWLFSLDMSGLQMDEIVHQINLCSAFPKQIQLAKLITERTVPPSRL